MTMPDTIKNFNTLANRIADVLNIEKIEPTDSAYNSLLVVVADPPDNPIGGAVNWDEKEQKWVVDIELQYAERVEDET